MNLFLIVLVLFFNRFTYAKSVSLAIIKTGESINSEFLVSSNGNILKKTISNHSAFLIKHDNEYILFDTGLGKKIDTQFHSSMPRIGQSFFNYKKFKSASEQLSDSNIIIDKIFLSHAHWDHASGIVDFEKSKIYMNENELLELNFPLNFVKQFSFFKSQFDSMKTSIIPMHFQKNTYLGFENSIDLFNDQSLILVSLPGHTYGSMGLFIHTNQKTYFLIGDLTWRLQALNQLEPKFFLASALVDRNKEVVLQTMRKVLKLKQDYPEMVIIPTHDEDVQSQLGYFPKWLN